MRLEEEIADVLIYALLLSHDLGIDPLEAIERKLEQNAKKYPVDLSKGNAVKYSERVVRNAKKHSPKGTQEHYAAPIQDSLFPTEPPTELMHHGDIINP